MAHVGQTCRDSRMSRISSLLNTQEGVRLKGEEGSFGSFALSLFLVIFTFGFSLSLSLSLSPCLTLLYSCLSLLSPFALSLSLSLSRFLFRSLAFSFALSLSLSLSVFLCAGIPIVVTDVTNDWAMKGWTCDRMREGKSPWERKREQELHTRVVLTLSLSLLPFSVSLVVSPFSFFSLPPHSLTCRSSSSFSFPLSSPLCAQNFEERRCVKSTREKAKWMTNVLTIHPG